MRTWRSSRDTSPLLTLLTGLCVTLTLAALALAATASLATAETAPDAARFAGSADDVVISGTVIGVGDGLIGIQEAAGVAPVAFPLAAEATLTRDGTPAVLADFRQNDPVHLTVDRASGTVRQIAAESAPRPPFQPSDGLAAFAFLGFVGGALVLASRRRRPLAVVELEAAPSHAASRLGLGDVSFRTYRRQPEFQG